MTSAARALSPLKAAQIGNVFACRTDRESVFRVGLLGNRMVLVGVAAEVAVLLGLMIVPPLRAIFGLVPPTPAEWGLVIAFPVVILLLDEGRKLLQRHASGQSTPARAERE